MGPEAVGSHARTVRCPFPTAQDEARAILERHGDRRRAGLLAPAATRAFDHGAGALTLSCVAVALGLGTAAQEDVARAIAAVSQGEAIFGPALAGRLIRFFNVAPVSASLPFPQLTEREREILDLMAGGLTNAEIAGRLFLSPKTVSNNVTVIFDKLQVAGRPKAIVQARNAGLGRAGSVDDRRPDERRR